MLTMVNASTTVAHALAMARQLHKHGCIDDKVTGALDRAAHALYEAATGVGLEG